MSIDRLAAQDAARTYVQNAQTAELGRTAAGGAANPGRAEHAAARRASRPDSVTLSANARSLVAAREAVNAAPDVREDKVAAIKQRISDGTYSVPAHVLARKMLSTSS